MAIPFPIVGPFLRELKKPFWLGTHCRCTEVSHDVPGRSNDRSTRGLGERKGQYHTGLRVWMVLDVVNVVAKGILYMRSFHIEQIYTHCVFDHILYKQGKYVIWYMMQASQSKHSVSGLITIFSPKFPTVSPWNTSLWPGYGFDSRRNRRRSSKTSVHNICKVAAAVSSHRFMDSITSSPDVFAPGPTLTGNVLYIQQNNRGYWCWWSSKKKIVTVLKFPKTIKTKCFLCAV